jgi:hypothetical protein
VFGSFDLMIATGSLDHDAKLRSTSPRPAGSMYTATVAAWWGAGGGLPSRTVKQGAGGSTSISGIPLPADTLSGRARSLTLPEILCGSKAPLRPPRHPLPAACRVEHPVAVRFGSLLAIRAVLPPRGVRLGRQAADARRPVQS